MRFENIHVVLAVALGIAIGIGAGYMFFGCKEPKLIELVKALKKANGNITRVTMEADPTVKKLTPPIGEVNRAVMALTKYVLKE